MNFSPSAIEDAFIRVVGLNNNYSLGGIKKIVPEQYFLKLY